MAPETSATTDQVTADSGLEPRHAEPPEQGPGSDGCEDTPAGSCLTSQPLPALTLPPVPSVHSLSPAPALQRALLPITNAPPLLPLLDPESVPSPTQTPGPCFPPPCDGTQLLANGPSGGPAHPHPDSEDLLALKQLTSLVPLEDSTDTLTGEGDLPSAPPPTTGRLSNPEQLQAEAEYLRTDVGPVAPPVACVQGAAPLADLSLLGSHWDGVRGLVQSACSSQALQSNVYQSRRLACKLLRSQGFAISSGSPCCRREAACCPGGAAQPGWQPAARSPAFNGPPPSSCPAAGRQFVPVSYASPSASSSPPPSHAPTYLDDDGLPVPMDAVQQRLRQIEAGYKQEVELLRQQVRQLQMRLESKQYSTPPSEPDVDYEDDIVSDLLGPLCICKHTPPSSQTRPLSVARRVCGSRTTATRRTLCPRTARTVCPRAAGTEWSAGTRRSVSVRAPLLGKESNEVHKEFLQY